MTVLKFLKDVTGITESERRERETPKFIRISDQRIKNAEMRLFVCLLIQRGQELHIKTIGDVVNNFDAIVDGSQSFINEKTEWERENYVKRIFWILTHFTNWYKEEWYLSFLENEADSPDGTIWYSCPKCGTIYVGSSSEEEVLQPQICGTCLRNDYGFDYEPWPTKTLKTDIDYDKLLKFVEWERRFWSDKGLQEWVDFKCRIRIMFFKIFHPIKYRNSCNRLPSD
jgi:hypothetical protein